MNLSVVGRGAVNAVGLSALQSCTAIRAGISGSRETGFYHDLTPLEPIVGAPIPKVWSEAEEPVDRIVSIAGDALAECLMDVDTGSDGPAVLLAWRETFRAELETPGKASLLDLLQRHLQIRFHPCSQILHEGNAGAFAALSIAHDLITSGKAGVCVVGGVDSYLNVFDITYYEANFRLLGPTVSRGFVPGEGAAFVALANPGRQHSRASICIRGVGLAREESAVTALSDGHPTGRGLLRALQEAEKNSGIAESEIAFRVSDVNGETYRGMESMLAEARFYRTRREHLEIWHPADCVGETGAGVGALLLIVAEYGMRKQYAPGRIAMCECSSDSGLRAACVVAASS